MAERTFFITGATGLLGTEVVSRLLETTDDRIYVLVRAGNTGEASQRLKSLWYCNVTLSSAVDKRVFPVVGDISLENLGMSDAEKRLLLPMTTHVIHCAADTGVQQSKHTLWQINVEGTRRMVELAKSMPRLQRFNYISTAYVAGTTRGVIKEEAPKSNRFYSHYEASKAEAERVVRQSGLPLTICRPGMIVGNSQTGHTRNFNTVYYVLKLILQGKMAFMPVSKRQTVNVVPVDYVAQQVVTLTLHPEAHGGTFHLLPSSDQLPRVGELIEEVVKWAKTNLLIDIRQPLFLPIPLLRTLGKHYNVGEKAKSRGILSNLTALMPYFLDEHIFDRSNTDRLTGEYHMDWRQYLPPLISFACQHNFMRLSDKSIFEQAIIRRSSRHYPLTYYNISPEGIQHITGDEMNDLVYSYVSQLQTLGVGPGDRVALSGVNSIDYAAIDNAIGLIGATSVPVYYTTPAEELALLLRKSGARWFFVGDERMKQNLGQIDDTVQVIPFSPLRQEPVKRGVPPTLPLSSRLNTDHLSTIRYTSGTTGEPKGVMFSFQQLKWMGEVLTNLLPWKDRNSDMRYLSFLPLSHVVEGILAAYAPYCLLCKGKVYYLTDFQMLTKALPMVRPTVFFSVPRFYEKLWEQIENNALGHRYMKMSEGKMKAAVGWLLRRTALRKAGLNHCSQLLVGSAPISEELLLRFRRLGIEIHNAYGQTEAPLITLNRLGDNVIPSIGKPLPETHVSLAADGELLVKGPQVAMGYFESGGETFHNGILYTGDLGRISADGHIFICGRKKDILITSYGKNINCNKIEQLLTDIEGVEQAVLVGEQRPYCTALLWTDGRQKSLDEAINEMNKRLSHPEQVKRWCVVETPLSIKNGELTPNLKVKRNVVYEHFHELIDKMYVGK